MNEIYVKKANGVATCNVDINDVLALLPDGHYTITIKRSGDGTSNRQRNLMRKWFACISQFTSVKPAEIHDWYCKQYLGYRTAFMGGADVCHGTSSLKVAQMTEFLEKIKQHAKEQLGITLPDPSDAQYDTFKKLY